MGCHSTMGITREDALSEIMKHLLHARDETIAEVLYDLAGRDRYYNFTIVREYQEPDEYGHPIQYSERGL